MAIVNNDVTIDAALTFYYEQLDEGKPLDASCLIAKFPNCAEELRKFFADEQRLNNRLQVICSQSGTSNRLSIRCPSCHHPTKVPTDTEFTDLTCESCGSRFGLIDQAHATAGAIPLLTVGRFELVERLGMGAFGTVWKARDKELDRTVAVKIPRQGAMSPEEQEKFFREARAAAQLSHPNIVSVHEVGRDGDSIYIVSDFVRGITLADWLTGQRPSGREAADLCAKIADALHHAHEKGVVHRDLKPANIMLDAELAPHIMDFGLARREVGEVTLTLDGHVLGTPAYMSPEQAEGKAHTADRRSDVYSVGVIFFQLLTGELPFRGNARMLIHQVINDEPPSPRKLNANINRDLETITLKCLEKEPTKRYQTSRELADELRRYLSGEPIHARPIGRAARGWRWIKRRPTTAALLSLLTAVGVVGPIVAIEQAALHNRANDLLIASEHSRAEVGKKNDELQSQLVANLIERGLSQCEAGKALRAISLYARAYEIARATDPLRPSALNLAASWSSGVGTSIVHDGPVYAVAFSPDGHTLLTGSRDKTARLWDATTGEPRGEPLRHDARVLAVTFSPDGRTLLTGSQDKTARLWDAATGKPRGEPLYHDDEVLAVAFSHDGRTLLTGSSDKTARLWDAATGKPRGEPLHHDGEVRAVAFSPDGRTLLTGSDDKTARLWDAATGKPRGEPLRHDDTVLAVTFSPDGRTLLTGCWDKTARQWDAATGKPWGEPLHHDARVQAVAFSPDGRTLLTGCQDKTARQWDAATGKPRGEPLHHDAGVQAVAFSPDGRTLLTGSWDKTARLWDAATSKPWGEPLRHDARVQAVAFSPDGRTLLTGSRDKTARQWDAATGKPRGEPLRHDGTVRAVAFSPDGRTLLTGGDDKTARLWDAATGKLRGEPLRHDDTVQAVAFSPDGHTLLTGSRDKTARLWDAATGEPRGEPLRHDARVQAVAFSPDGRTLLTGCQDKTARLWDAATSKPRGEPLHHDSTVQAVAFSPDGHTLITGSRDWTARLWDAATGNPRGEPLRHDSTVWAVAFSPDGRTLLTTDGTARLWDAATGNPRGEPLRHNSEVRALAFSPDGRTLLTGSGDKTARLWDLPQLPDNPKVVRTWAIAKTGLTLDDQGNVRGVTQAEWLKACEELKKLRSELPNPNVLSWMDRRVIPGYAPYNRSRVVLDEVANGLFLRARSTAVQIGPDAVDQLMKAVIAYTEEAPQPMDALVLGELQLLAGEPQSAETAVRAAIKRDGTKLYSYKSLGLCLLAQGKLDEARKAFEEALKDRKRKNATYDLEKADPDQMTAAYVLDLVSEQAYVKHFASDKKLTCFPWFYVAQRCEIEGKNDAANKAYERCVELGAGDNPHMVRALAEWRLRKLKESAQPGQE